MLERSLPLVLIGLLGTACSPPGLKPPAQEPTPPASTDAVFGLETRDYQLLLHSGERGRLYTVKDHEGRVLAERIDEAQLRRSYPELADLLYGGVDATDVDD